MQACTGGWRGGASLFRGWMLDGTGGGMQGAVLVVAGLHLEESMHDLLGLFQMTGSNRTHMAIHSTRECVRHSLPFVASLHVHLFH